VEGTGLRQFMGCVPESMRAELLARRHAQDAALDASRAAPPASGPENAWTRRRSGVGPRASFDLAPQRAARPDCGGTWCLQR